MRKHAITAYTFAEGDVLYYIDKNRIKSVVLTKEHLDKSDPKEILEDYILKPNEKVEQRRGGKLVLWNALSKDKGLYKRDVYHYCDEFIYEKVNSPFAVDEELLKKELEKRK